MKKLLIICLGINPFSLLTKNCPNPSWRTKEECKADEGNWVDETGESCKPMEKWNPQPEGTVCCAGCTDDSMEEMGSD